MWFSVVLVLRDSHKGGMGGSKGSHGGSGAAAGKQVFSHHHGVAGARRRSRWFAHPRKSTTLQGGLLPTAEE